MFNSKKIIDCLLKITTNTKTDSSDNLKHFNHFWMSEGIFVELDEESVKDKNEILREIFQDSFVKNTFPMSFIEDQINRLISLSFKLPLEERPKFFAEQIKEFPDNLKKSIKEWTIIVPIDNLKIEKKFTIGDVIFYPSDNNQNFDRIVDLFKEVLKENTHYSNEQKEALINDQLKVLRDSAKGSLVTFAEVKTKGIIEIAQNEAMNKIRMSLNIARLYNLPYDDSGRKYFGICGEVIRSNLRYIMRYESGKPSLRPIMERTGFVLPFEFTEKRLQFMKENGYSDLEALFVAKKQTEFEKRLLTSIYWYGEAINTEIHFDSKDNLESNSDFTHLQYFNLNQQFLKLMVALESVLLFNNDEPISNNISERSAFLLANCFKGRKKVKRVIKELYAKRSKIVHHGNSVLTPWDLHQLSWIVQNTIFNLIKLNKTIPLNDKKDLQEYFEKLKLS